MCSKIYVKGYTTITARIANIAKVEFEVIAPIMYNAIAARAGQKYIIDFLILFANFGVILHLGHCSLTKHSLQ